MLRIMKYPGSKTAIVDEIQKSYNLSKCSKFVDVFAGSGSVIINIHAGIEVYNDLNRELYVLFNTLKNNFTELYKAAAALAYDRNMFFDYYDDRIVMDTENSNVEKAFSIFFNFNSNFGGMGDTYGKKDKSLYGTYRKNVSNLLKAEPKIRKMKIENMDFREIIDKYDDPDTFFYLDPPYPGKDWYVHNFLESDFTELKKIIKNIKGTYLMNFNSIDTLPVKVFGKPTFVKDYANENGKPGEAGTRKVSFYTNMNMKI
jgi:DNA adenine methylase